jgi:hypothetical protein
MKIIIKIISIFFFFTTLIYLLKNYFLQSYKKNKNLLINLKYFITNSKLYKFKKKKFEVQILPTKIDKILNFKEEINNSIASIQFKTTNLNNNYRNIKINLQQKLKSRKQVKKTKKKYNDSLHFVNKVSDIKKNSIFEIKNIINFEQKNNEYKENTINLLDNNKNKNNL